MDDIGHLGARGMAASRHASDTDIGQHIDQATRPADSSSFSAAAAGHAAAADDVNCKDVYHKTVAARLGTSSAPWQQPDQNSNAGAKCSGSSSSLATPGPLPVEHAADVDSPPVAPSHGGVTAPGGNGSSSSTSSRRDNGDHSWPAAVAAASSPPGGDDFVVIDLAPSNSNSSTCVTHPPPAAAAAAAGSSSRLQLLLQQLRPPSQLPVALQRDSSSSMDAATSTRQVGNTNLTRSSTSLSKGSAPGQRECRICLAADMQEDIVQPCSCSGTVQYAHLECLKAWVAERCSLECELCGKQYRDGVRQQLEPLIDPRKKRARQRSALRAITGGSAGDSVLTLEGLDASGSASEDESRPQISWTRFWIHLGILVMLLVAVLYLSLFVNVGSSDNFWLMFLWRAITVILPLFLIIRCVAALYTWRQQYVASRRQ